MQDMLSGVSSPLTEAGVSEQAAGLDIGGERGGKAAHGELPVLSPAAAIDRPADAPSLEANVAFPVLGLVCTAGGLMLYGMLVAVVGAGRALVVTYVNPVVAVALGVMVLDESMGLGAIVGLVLILVGSWVSTSAAPRLAHQANAAIPEAQCCASAELERMSAIVVS